MNGCGMPGRNVIKARIVWMAGMCGRGIDGEQKKRHLLDVYAALANLISDLGLPVCSVDNGELVTTGSSQISQRA